METREKLTPFGKMVRKFRIDRNLLLKEMADGIGISPAWLSGVETGKKPIPAALAEKIANYLDLGREDRVALENAVEISRSSQAIKNIPSDRRDVAAALARRFNDFDEDDVARIREILKRKK